MLCGIKRKMYEYFGEKQIECFTYYLYPAQTDYLATLPSLLSFPVIKRTNKKLVSKVDIIIYTIGVNENMFFFVVLCKAKAQRESKHQSKKPIWKTKLMEINALCLIFHYNMLSNNILSFYIVIITSVTIESVEVFKLLKICAIIMIMVKCHQNHPTYYIYYYIVFGRLVVTDKVKRERG